ncbi:MAG: Hsp20/alpha crystallin family protein [Burkholderiaceae bacterium]
MTDNRSNAVVEARRDEPVLLPPVDIVEDESGITVYADLPGVPKDKLTVRADGESLTIEGEISFGMPEKMDAVLAEIQAPRYRRSFTLSRELDTEKSDAVFKDGVLRLRIPKVEHAKPRRIEVKVA